MDDVEFTDDQMTLEELGAYEDITGESWLIANPVQTVKHATAFITVGLARAGLSDEEIVGRLAGLTREDLKGMFTFEPDEKAVAAMRAATEGGGDPAVPLDLSTVSSVVSSSGVSAGGSGHRKRRARSA